MVFGLYSQVFEYGIRPEALHVVPVFHLTVSYRVSNAITRVVASDKCFVSNKEVKIFRPSLTSQVGTGSTAASEVRRLIRYRWSSRSRPRSRPWSTF